LLAITTFASLEMKRSAARTRHALAAAERRQVGERQFTASLSLTAAALVVGIVAAAPVFFFLLPRISAGYLGAFAPRNELVSGFGNDVNLGEIGQIQQSSTVVMHVTLEGKHPAPESIKWRGTALYSFDGRRWTSAAGGDTVPRILGEIDFTRAHARLGDAEHAGFEPLRYRVLMEPIGMDVFFLPPVVHTLYGNYRAVHIDEGGAIYNADRERQITAYTGVSNIAQPSPAQLRGAVGELPARISLRYLQTPRVDRRVPALAQSVTASATTPYEKAAALELYLRTNFGYTLQLPSAPVADPLANFLFERKQGHCEYFASAMAVMLRTLGIPSRIVNGFRNGEYNDVTGSYIIRARDAHSWVEAWFPDAGWIAFDPTPASTAPQFKSGWSRLLLYVDAMREFWREWIINYDFTHQRTLTTSVASNTRQWAEGQRLRVRREYFRLLAAAERVRNQAAREPGKWSFRGLAIAVIVLLLVNARRLVRAWRRRRLLRQPERAPTQAAGLWYERMTRTLARRGWPKPATQAPREFVAAIEDRELRRRVESFTDVYERARFGASADAAKELPERYEELVDK
jgi:transglutaminase-like putative cysteine protease